MVMILLYPLLSLNYELGAINEKILPPHNGFCLLSKKPQTPLFVTDNIKLDGIPTKVE